MVERDSSAELKAENARLIALLEANGIQWRMQQPERSSPASAPEPSRVSTDENVALFRWFAEARLRQVGPEGDFFGAFVFIPTKELTAWHNV